MSYLMPMSEAAQVFEIITAAAICFGFGYYLVCLYSAAQLLRERKHPGEVAVQTFPPVSILKPLKGTDPEMYDSFRSHCLQDYPEYEIIFGVSDSDDPVIPLVRRLQAEFADLPMQLVHCDKNLGANTKISNLVQMLPFARYPVLVVSDSDIRVDPGYLRSVVTPLNDSRIGLVTSLYRAVAGPSLGSKLESIGVSTDFCPSVLVARAVQGVRFAFGSTLAFRRSDLEAIGGFEPLLEYLADDYEFGVRIASSGLKVKLSENVVETFLPAYTMRQFFQHQLRWARTVRDARRWGYIGFAFTFAFFWAIVTLCVSRGALWAWSLFAATIVLRGAVAVVVGRYVLHDSHVAGRLGLVPVRDLIAVAVWIASFAGHTVNWRGSFFRLKDGKLARISP